MAYESYYYAFVPYVFVGIVASVMAIETFVVGTVASLVDTETFVVGTVASFLVYTEAIVVDIEAF